MFTCDGAEAQFGDVITFSTITNHPLLGKVETTCTTPITEENIRTLVEEGVLTTKDRKESTVDLKALCKATAESLCAKYRHRSMDSFNKAMSRLQDTDPSIVFSIYLKEMAILLDKKYPQHINKCKEIYYFDNIMGNISKCPTCIVKSFKNFAAFRTLDDAKIACAALRKVIKIMYNGQ